MHVTIILLAETTYNLIYIRALLLYIAGEEVLHDQNFHILVPLREKVNLSRFT